MWKRLGRGGGGERKNWKRGRGEVGGASGTQKFGYQKWPNPIFPIVNFVFSRDGHFGMGSGVWGGGGGRGVQEGVPPPPLPPMAPSRNGTFAIRPRVAHMSNHGW